MVRVLLASPSPSVIDKVKDLADEHRWEIGFHSRKAFEDSAERSQLIIAADGRDLLGFVRFHHRRDHRTSIYEIVTKPEARGSGIGKQLIDKVKTCCRAVGSRSIRLSCPAELGANKFYAAAGFEKIGSKAGKDRPLYEWELTLQPRRPLVFVASLTASASDLTEMIKLWEKFGTGRPFAKCIFTPLFVGPGTLKHIRYMHDAWGVSVTFDSAGFFVQQGKIQYDELFVRLLDFYRQNSWAESYVLPDFVPTSRNTPAEVAERVQVTVAEGLKFLRRLPEDLRLRSVGVLQGHQPRDLRHCFAEFTDKGLRRLGFGSFDTRGANEEINILTQDAATRLGFVKELIERDFKANGIPTDLHLFGVSSPSIIQSFRGFGATSFDSSGWLRTAGFGNVYLPFQTRRNVSHGAAAVSVGMGLRASDFYAEAERSNHTCAFCADFSQLQHNRFFRMWHNSIVFEEMTKTLNNGNRAQRSGRTVEEI